MEHTIKITGMTCAHCEKTVKQALLQQSGVKSVSVSHQSGIAYIRCETKLSDKQIDAVLTPLGYGLKTKRFDVNQLIIIGVGLALFALFQYVYGRLNFQINPAQVSISLVVLYGLVSSLHCVSMCGGLALTANLGRA